MRLQNARGRLDTCLSCWWSRKEDHKGAATKYIWPMSQGKRNTQMSVGNEVLIAQARAEGAAIDMLMRSLGNGQGHPRCPACGLRIKSKAHFNMRVTTLKRTWVEVGPRTYKEQFVAVDEHRTARLMELARASEQSLKSLAAKFSK